jgi:serine/threonine-protein kinase
VVFNARTRTSIMSQSSASQQRLRPFKPQRFGRYTLLMPISTGGMGEIFLGRLEGAHGFDKLCVIKKILPHLAEDPEFVERFVNEARILVKLSHGNIAQVLDMGVHEGAPYIALEFVDGKDLRRVLARMRDRKLPIPMSFALTVMTRVLDALAYAHRKRGEDDRELNLVHRDISPQNILISYEGEVKVIDFGLAKSTLSSSKTNPSILLGKFLYMSPEQAKHQKVDRRSDLYAVGLCLYELVTGHNPFEDVPPGELMARVANPAIRPLSEVEPLTPKALSDAVAKALQPDPALRFQTAEEFRARLQATLLDIDPSAGPETASRFMREAFGVEYHAERRMLAALKEQARQMAAEAGDDGGGEEASRVRRRETLDGSESTEPPRPTPLMTPVVSEDAGGRLEVQPLSFQPTRKMAERKRLNPEADMETSPGMMPAEPKPRRLVKSRDEEPTEAAALAVPEPHPPPEVPSVVVDGLPSEPVRTELEMPVARTPSTPPRSSAKESSGGRRSRVKATPKADNGDKADRGHNADKGEKAKRGEKTSERAMVKREPPPPPPEAQPVSGSTSAPPKKASAMVWLVLPLLAVLAVGSYIAWDVYTEHLKQQQLAEEEAAHPEAVPEAPETSREVKVGGVSDAEQVAPLPEQPEKATPDKDKTRKKTDRPKAAAGASAGAKALAALKADYGKLVDEGVAKKYKLKLHQLETDVASKGDDPGFVSKVTALHEQVKAELEKQQ